MLMLPRCRLLLLLAFLGGCAPEVPVLEPELGQRPDGGDWPADEVFPAGLHRTESGYYSWEQPDSALNGYEGRCGQTAMANIAWHCGYVLRPTDAIRLAPDLTPGTRPGRLASGLNRIAEGACGEFRVCRPNTGIGAQPIPWLMDKVHAHGRGHPTPVLITSGDALHWVTVVRVGETPDRGCEVVYLEHGTETHRSCGLFQQTWALDFNLSGLVTRGTILGRYTAICRNAPAG